MFEGIATLGKSETGQVSFLDGWGWRAARYVGYACYVGRVPTDSVMNLLGYSMVGNADMWF